MNQRALIASAATALLSTMLLLLPPWLPAMLQHPRLKKKNVLALPKPAKTTAPTWLVHIHVQDKPK